jgi:hypothetical protein
MTAAAAVAVMVLVVAVETMIVAAEQEETFIHNLYYSVNSNRPILVKRNL